MFKSLIKSSSLVALTLSSLSLSAAEAIDLFESDQQAVTAGFIIGGSYVPSAFGSGTGSDIIGGERDIIVAAGDGTTVQAYVQFDELNISSNGNSGSNNNDWTVEVQWDGIDNSAALNTTPGLVPTADLSDLQGFSATINNSDGGGSFEITVYDKQSNNSIIASTVTLPFLPVDGNGSKPNVPDGPVTFTIPFNFLSPQTDLSNVVAISLKLSSDSDTDVRVAAIYAVPAPSSLAVLGLGLLGFAGFARRKA